MAINIDVNATRHMYKDDELLVTSIFYTLQGEGMFTGKPCIFIRLAGCNFGSKTEVCMQCDTAFSLAKAKRFSPESLYDNVKQFADSVLCYNIVITGGEPTLQNAIKLFIKNWQKLNKGWVQIETNGTIPSFYTDDLWAEIKAGIYICCSPKCNEITKKYVRIPSIVDANVTFYKYLLSSKINSCYHTLPSNAFTHNKPVYVSPITVYKGTPFSEIVSIWNKDLIDIDATAQNYSYAARYVMEHPNLILSLQTHLFTAIP